MSTRLPPHLQHQLKPLITRSTLHRLVDLGSNRFAHPEGTGGRGQEVCMVFRRPSGEVLTFRKTFYPPGVYRLPTGGIKPGEGIVEGLRREVKEETGLTADPHRLLAAVAYHGLDPGQVPSAYTFAFLLGDVRATPAAVDLQEQIEDFRWVKVDELLTLSEELMRLGTIWSPDLQSTWVDWGRFRVVIHQVVWEALQRV